MAHQRLAVEGAPQGEDNALALMDLVKVYELVPHQRILEGAIRVGLPFRVLRVIFPSSYYFEAVVLKAGFLNSIS